MFERVYELPIAIDYVRHWGMLEATREIIQNALDSDSPFEWNVNKDILTITSKFARLEPKSLLLGTTSKADNKDAIGSFGEGYKIALLVLTRLGYKVVIYNNDTVWKPEFRRSNKFGADMLCVVSTNNTSNKEGVTFEISGLSEGDIDGIKDSCLYMQKDIGQVKNTSKGLILMDKPNTLYVGGLFICKTVLNYGYDIKPEFIKLERDRQTVAEFDFKWVVKDMWLATEDFDEIAKLVEENIPDLEYIANGSTELLKEACYRLFKKNNGDDAIVASSQKEVDDLVEAGLTKTVYVRSSGFSALIKSSSSYSDVKLNTARELSIAYDLDQWLQDNKKHMRRSAIANFSKLIDKSNNWRKT